MEITDIIVQIDLVNIYRAFHPNTKEYTFLSKYYATFSQTNHVLDHKTKNQQIEKIEIIPCILSDHHWLKLEFNNNTNYRKTTNSWRLNNSQLNYHWTQEEIKKKYRLWRIKWTWMKNIHKITEHNDAMLRGKFIALRN